MKTIFVTFVCFLLLMVGSVSAQSQTPSDSSGYFPEAADIDASSRILGPVFEDASGIARVLPEGRLVSDVGFIRYERADYFGVSPLSIEVFTLLDFKAAYSLLTLLQDNPVQQGPPGDSYTSGNDGLLFAQGRFFVRIQGENAPKGLFEKTAAAISAEIFPSGGEYPGLIDYFPSEGYDVSTLRYFPSPDAYKTWVKEKTPEYIDTSYDMELATAHYFAENHSGTVSLLRFPTPEFAEEYYDELALSAPAAPNGLSIYAKRAGPIVACLEGSFDPVSAGKLLAEVKYSYSMRWIDDNGNNAGVIWGIPGIVLRSVVNSIFFSFVACIAAILFGLAFGIGLFALRQYKRNRSMKPIDEGSGLTWLNLR